MGISCAGGDGGAADAATAASDSAALLPVAALAAAVAAAGWSHRVSRRPVASREFDGLMALDKPSKFNRLGDAAVDPVAGAGKGRASGSGSSGARGVRCVWNECGGKAEGIRKAECHQVECRVETPICCVGEPTVLFLALGMESAHAEEQVQASFSLWALSFLFVSRGAPEHYENRRRDQTQDVQGASMPGHPYKSFCAVGVCAWSGVHGCVVVVFGESEFWMTQRLF